MDDPNITMEENIRLEEENARKRGKVFNWETAKYGQIWYDKDVHDLRSVETEFPTIVFNDSLTSNETPSCEPTVSSLNDEIDFRILFDESDDEDYMVVFDKNSFSYKIISTNNLKTDSENNNDEVNMSSPEPEVSYFDDLDFFKDFENEFPAIVYNDALTSKSDFLTEPTVSPQRIDEFDLKDETSLSECEKEEQNVLYFNDLFSFKVIYPDDSKLDKDNDDDKIDIEHYLGDMSVVPLPNVINTDDGAYALRYQYGVSWGPSKQDDNIGGVFINLEMSKCWSLEISRRLFNTFLLKNSTWRIIGSKQSGEFPLIMKSLVKKKQKGAILALKRRHLKKVSNCTNTLYPIRKIQRICANSSQETHSYQFPIRRSSPTYLMRYNFGVVWALAKSLGWLSIFASLRMKYRLSLKNDMPLRDKIIIALINKPAFYRIIHG
ncbi:hypothetical protein Tco_0821128 [Tanacetum coccineum]|uniref:Uncharacterized protein n=1 Tax=Tanacetum coccineum TaxID=301880 RepID=A0ABQ5AD35_9ASTR